MSALFQVRVPVFPVSVVCCNTSALSDGCSPRVPGLVRVQQPGLVPHSSFPLLSTVEKTYKNGQNRLKLAE